MASVASTILRLSDLADGQEGECFAALVKRDEGTDKHGNPYYKCLFRDKRMSRVAPIWSNDPLRIFAADWALHQGYRLRVKAEDSKYGPQIKLIECRLVVPEDSADGYDFFDLVESSKYAPDLIVENLRTIIARNIRSPHILQLLEVLIARHGDLLRKMPAAMNNHHSYSGGLVEHLWSVTRVAVALARHYGEYYSELNPPLDRDVIVAAAILHDIGKLRELDYHPVEAKYTKHGTLIGHIVLGRDMVRDAARDIAGFPDETLLLLEHAILAHHGQMQFGAPKEPATIEALIVHYADDIDAKINAVAAERMKSNTDGDFTARIWAAGNRTFYKGIPIAPPTNDLDPMA